MSKITIIFILIFSFGVMLLLGWVLLKWWQILPLSLNSIEESCCRECLDFISKTPDSEKCLDNPKIKEECREFFEKNPDKEKKCAKSISWISWLKYLKFWEKPSGTDNSGLGQWFGKTCDKPYAWWRDLEEIEKRFNGKTWSGTFSADLHNQEGDGYSYSVKISGLHMVFDSDVETFIKTDQSFKNKKVNIWTPCTDESYLGFVGIKMEGIGEITYSIFKNEIQLSCGGLDETHPTTCVVTNNPIIVDIRGKIYFTDEGIKLFLLPAKPGVNMEEIFSSCGEDLNSCDTEELLDKMDIRLEGYCDGTCQMSGDRIHCVMNKDDICGYNWNVKETMGEGLVEFVNERDIRLNENESNHIGSSFIGDSEKKYYITGTLYLND